MSLPSLSVSADLPEAEDGDVLARFVLSSPEGAKALGGGLNPAVVTGMRATGAADQVLRMPGGVMGDRPALLVGAGPERTAAALRAAAGAAARAARGDARLVIDAADLDEGELAAVFEGAALGGYAYAGAPHREADSAPAARIVVVTTLEGAESIGDRAGILAEAVALTRDLGNTPALELGPDDLAAAASAAVADLPVEVRVWDEGELAADGFGGIAGVGLGSARGPRLVRLDYAPARAKKHLAIVGKGITFDTGGLSLKSPVSMIGMKYDMIGAASVLSTVVAVARLGLPVHVTGWMCIAENMPSGSAIRPGDVLTIRGGTRVEVTNTDAEGRLVLADGLRAAAEESPDLIIDIATLTGAEVVSLGTRYSAVMGDDTAVRLLTDAAANAGELLWPMPLPEELRSRLTSDVADLVNATPGNTAAGMLLAGVFLREFTGPATEGAVAAPWAHLDIAGSAQNTASPYGYTVKGATGVLVRTLVEAAERFGSRSARRAATSR